ncbi:hypothetical protein WEI85_47935 [Actinomycetes bacterium KLBMP 9797]
MLVLDDITIWKPHPAATIVRPAAIPGDARLYAPYSDGIWLQGPRDTRMTSVQAEPADLAASFGAPQIVDQFAATLATRPSKRSSPQDRAGQRRAEWPGHAQSCQRLHNGGPTGH